jgi:hypothetical protein
MTSRPLASLLCAAAVLGGAWLPAAEDPAGAIGGIRPLLDEFCLGCHSTAKHKGDFDLERHLSADGIRRHPEVWQRVLEQVGDGEMPPEDEAQPSTRQRAQLLTSIGRVLDAVALETAGDPGPVLLRRLSNAEYTYTVRDLTGVATLDPVREFPVDGAAGEGFTNTGMALAMSPALAAKYLAAAKDVASHAVLLPDGIRFSAATTRRDWTQELVEEIRGTYRRSTETGGSGSVTLQGIVLDKGEGGRLPLERYLAASLELRGSGRGVEEVARERGLNARYLGTLVDALRGGAPAPLFDQLRARWRTVTADGIAGLARDLAKWQEALWRFNGIGHIGLRGGPTAWMEAVSPLVTRQELRHRPAIPSAGGEVVLRLRAEDIGGGRPGALVLWQRPHLVLPGRPPMPLRAVRGHVATLEAQRGRLVGATAAALAAAAEAEAATGAIDIAGLAGRHGVEPAVLAAWFGYLGIAAGEPVLGLLTNRMPATAANPAVAGWGSGETPLLLANSSDQHLRIPGKLKPGGVVLHPSPALRIAVGWRSPLTGSVRLAGSVTHAHPECGNGVEWAVELRRGSTRLRLASGTVQGGAAVSFGPFEQVAVRQGDLVSVLVGPRDGNHSCDLTDVEFTIDGVGPAAHSWSLAREVAGDVLAGNPHADGAGRAGVWHFYSEPLTAAGNAPTFPAGSLLARWRTAAQALERTRLASELQRLLTAGPPAAGTPDAELHRQATSLAGPLCAAAAALGTADAATLVASPWGVDPALFGERPDGTAIDPDSLMVRTPSLIEIRLPAELASGSELVTTGVLDPAETGASVRLRLDAGPDGAPPGDLLTGGPSSILVAPDGAAHAALSAAFAGFRELFPAALCYSRIVPADEVITLVLFHREDAHLSRLMLDPMQRATLDRRWDELRFVSQDALTTVDAFEQLWQYSTQDGDPTTLEPLRKPIAERAAAFRQRLVEAEPRQVEAVLAFAAQAYRRPLGGGEEAGLRALYRTLRGQDLAHDEAIRFMLARVLVGPEFLYRLERTRPGPEPTPVGSWELASRLSYFLWSSQPDEELRSAAASGALADPEVLVAQARRMLRDQRVRRLATEFGCAWLHIHAFDQLDEKSDRHFPTFVALRGAMYEEAIRFFTDFFQADRPVTGLLDADHAFLDQALAAHYGIPGVDGPQWRRVEGIKAHGRGGILGLGATLAKHSGASRTSPILRGNWVAEALLGDRLPRPPKDVPQLPEEEGDESLSMRQLTERHTSDPRCAGCHKRIDAFGYALEGFDAIGRGRERDAGGRPIDTTATIMDGSEVRGLAGLRAHLLGTRRDAFVRQFCRKLLGYALGRGVQLSDQPLLERMRAAVVEHGTPVGGIVELVVRSRQFREIRGRDAIASSRPAAGENP